MSTAVLFVKVLPNAAQEEIVGWEGEELKIRLKAIPEKGKANHALIAFLAKKLSVPKNAIVIVRGETNRHKRLTIDGLTKAQLLEKLTSDAGIK